MATAWGKLSSGEEADDWEGASFSLFNVHIWKCDVYLRPTFDRRISWWRSHRWGGLRSNSLNSCLQTEMPRDYFCAYLDGLGATIPGSTNIC